MIWSNASITFLLGVGKTDELELKTQVIPMLYNTKWSIKNQYMLKLETEVICQLFIYFFFVTIPTSWDGESQAAQFSTDKGHRQSVVEKWTTIQILGETNCLMLFFLETRFIKRRKKGRNE